MAQLRKTPAQKKALDAYNNAHGQKLIEEKTKVSYNFCLSLGMTHEHDL